MALRANPIREGSWDRISLHDGPAAWSGEEEGMEAIFWFVFGMVAGIGVLPHLQRIAARVRRELAEFDQPKHPSSKP
jgi:hypothetical protein